MSTDWEGSKGIYTYTGDSNDDTNRPKSANVTTEARSRHEHTKSLCLPSPGCSPRLSLLKRAQQPRWATNMDPYSDINGGNCTWKPQIPAFPTLPPCKQWASIYIVRCKKKKNKQGKTIMPMNFMHPAGLVLCLSRLLQRLVPKAEGTSNFWDRSQEQISCSKVTAASHDPNPLPPSTAGFNTWESCTFLILACMSFCDINTKTVREKVYLTGLSIISQFLCLGLLY